MDKILTDAAFKDADMVVLYGSGMNQNVGHRPSAAESDSDVHVIFPDSVYVGGASDAPHWMPVNNALSEIGPQMGLAPGMLGMDFLPKHTKDALSPSEPGKLNTFSSLLPKGEEKKNWEDLLTKARSEGWSRRTLKQHFYERFGYGFKPDDLIIVKTPQRKEGDLSTNEIVKALSGNGYTNIVIAK